MYVRDPYDTDQPPCFCPVGSAHPVTTEEYCPAHGDPAKPPPEPVTCGIYEPEPGPSREPYDSCMNCGSSNEVHA